MKLPFLSRNRMRHTLCDLITVAEEVRDDAARATAAIERNDPDAVLAAAQSELSSQRLVNILRKMEAAL